MKTKRILSAVLVLAMIMTFVAMPVLADGNVAQIGTTEYETLSEAIAALNETSTSGEIVLLQDCAEGGCSINGKLTEIAVTLDLNGKTFTSTSGDAFDVFTGNTFTLKDSVGGGKVVACNKKGVLYVKGSANITGGNYIANEDGGFACDKNNAAPTGLTITGGTFNVDPSNFTYDWGDHYINCVAEGYKSVANGTTPETWTVKKEQSAVAKIGEKEYTKLSDAIAAAQSGDTIRLMADVTENVTVAEGQNIILDLAGNTINGGTVSGKAAITNKGTLTIIGEGTIKREDTGSPAYYVLKNEGDLTFHENFTGTVTNNSGFDTGEPWEGTALIDNGTAAGQTLTINGGNFTQKNFIVIKNEEYGTLEINGGTFTAHGYFEDTNIIASAVQNWHEATINGGSFSGGVDTMSYGQTANTVITDGEFTNTTFWQWNYKTDSNIPTLEIKGGSFVMADKAWAFGENKGIGISENEAIAISNTATTNPVFNISVPKEYCAEGYVANPYGDGRWIVEKASASEIVVEKPNFGEESITVGEGMTSLTEPEKNRSSRTLPSL